MRGYIQPGNTITLPAPYAVASGDGLLVGAIFGIATGSAAITLLVQRRTAETDFIPVGLRIQNPGWKIELLRKLQCPLLPERSRADDQQPPLSLGPELAEDNSRLDRLAQTDLVGEQDTL